jgi:hypothetical protein
MRPLSLKSKKTPRHIDTWATAFIALIVIAAIVFWVSTH